VCVRQRSRPRPDRCDFLVACYSSWDYWPTSRWQIFGCRHNDSRRRTGSAEPNPPAADGTVIGQVDSSFRDEALFNSLTCICGRVVAFAPSNPIRPANGYCFQPSIELPLPGPLLRGTYYSSASSMRSGRTMPKRCWSQHEMTMLVRAVDQAPT